MQNKFLFQGCVAGIVGGAEGEEEAGFFSPPLLLQGQRMLCRLCGFLCFLGVGKGHRPSCYSCRGSGGFNGV